MYSKRVLLSVFAYIVLMASMFLGGFAYAQVPSVDVPEVNVDVPIPQVNVDVNPNVPSGSEINCEIYAQLIAMGQPIPPGFDGSGCGGNGGGGSTPACSDGVDNDGDSLVDSADPGCSGATDTDESNSSGGGNPGGDNSGGNTGGNSGGPAPACEDSLDNDGDGLKDSADPGCSSPADNDETNGASGGGGGSAATSTAVSSATSTATTESSLPVVASCDMYLTAFIKPGAKNDNEQVMRLQSLLNESEGAGVEVNGTYDTATVAAVHAFQTKYADDILAPWGAKKSTGFVYLTTRKKVNEIYCKLTKEFPLTSEESETIAKTRSQIAGDTTSVTTPAVTSAQKAQVKEEIKTEEVGSTKTESQTASAGNESATRSIRKLWSPISNFFNRILGR